MQTFPTVWEHQHDINEVINKESTTQKKRKRNYKLPRPFV